MKGDGHIFGHLSPAVVASGRQLRQQVSSFGRSADNFGLEAIADFSADPDLWAPSAKSWEDAGGTHLAIRTMATAGIPDSACQTVDDHLTAFGAWRDALRHAGIWRTSSSVSG